MIVLDEKAPNWLQDLGRFAALKHLLFVYGNVNDLVSYPIEGKDNSELVWQYNTLPDVLQRLLLDMGYEIVGAFDPLDAVGFALPEMEERFDKVARGKGEAVPAKCDADGVAPQPASTSPGKPRRWQSGPEDLDQAINDIATALRNETVPCAFVVNLASRFLSSPDNLDDNKRKLFTRFLKSCSTSQGVRRGTDRWNNLVIMVCDKLNDLPGFLYLGNPRSRSICISVPDREERLRFIDDFYAEFNGAQDGGPRGPTESVAEDFVDLTEGLTQYELQSLVAVSHKEGISIGQQNPGAALKNIVERYKYGTVENHWLQIEDKVLNAEERIRGRVMGQDHAVARVLDILKRAKFGLAAGESGHSQRPRGVLFFAGPTGVGKTELAKALAESLFGDDSRLVRFDMSEYSSEHSDQRLMGAPPGYVGYEEGGQLTEAVKREPFSILLFDEIEKAHQKIFDKFLQILDDGRLTDGKGETVYFSEAVIVFTSNLGTVGENEGADGSESPSPSLVNPKMSYPKLRDTILGRIKDHFIFTLHRPEILSRFGDNFVVFNFIQPPLDRKILDKLIRDLQKAAMEKSRVQLEIEPEVREKLLELAGHHLDMGGRGIRNSLQQSLVDPLCRKMFDEKVPSPATVLVKQLVDEGDDAPNRFSVEIEIVAK